MLAGDIYQACGKLRAEVQDCCPWKILVKGKFIDSIQRVNDSIQHPHEPQIMPARNIENKEQVIKYFKKWEAKMNMGRNSSTDYIGGGSTSDAFWRTLCGNCITDKSATVWRQSRSEDRKLYINWKRWLLDGYASRGIMPQLQDGRLNEHTMSFHSTVMLDSTQKFFMTSKGFIG